MQQSAHQQPVTVSSLLGLMALAIAAGRSKAKAEQDDTCAVPARRDAVCCAPQDTATA